MTCSPSQIYGGGVIVSQVVDSLKASGFKVIGFHTPKLNDYYLLQLSPRPIRCTIDRATHDFRVSRWTPRLILEDIL